MYEGAPNLHLDSVPVCMCTSFTESFYKRVQLSYFRDDGWMRKFQVENNQNTS